MLYTFRDIANELGCNVTTVRRFVKRYGFEVVETRSEGTGNQLSKALTEDSYQAFLEKRKMLGFLKGEGGRMERGVIPGDGVFYFILLVPDAIPNRVKLGFTSDLHGRVASHACSAPTLEVVQTWPCKRAWEAAAIAAITNVDNVKQIGGEVFDFGDKGEALKRATDFFSLMQDL